jgi:hypothetical protein
VEAVTVEDEDLDSEKTPVFDESEMGLGLG